MIKIDAQNMNYRQLNNRLRVLPRNCRMVEVFNIFGQRYLAAGFSQISFRLQGTVGNNLAAFADGIEIEVFGNAQDGAGNTLNSGSIKIHGHAADIPGYSMRGGQIWIRDDVGYRCGIHMKAFHNQQPLIIVGGICGDFLGEYMAGGTILVLGLGTDRVPVGQNTGTGMHGGEIYIRGRVPEERLAFALKKREIAGTELLKEHPVVLDFVNHFNIEHSELVNSVFTRLAPQSSRPYGQLYSY